MFHTHTFEFTTQHSLISYTDFHNVEKPDNYTKLIVWTTRVFFYSNGLLSRPIESIMTSMVMPDFIGKAPGPVPHAIISPGISVMFWEM